MKNRYENPYSGEYEDDHGTGMEAVFIAFCLLVVLGVVIGVAVVFG
jgi:hypothetical protein